MKTSKPITVISMIVFLAVLLTLNGCSSSDDSIAVATGSTQNDSSGSGSELLASPAARELNPVNTPDESEIFVEDNNRFAVELYHEVRGQNDNLFFSPYSISIAMAMTWAGAKNDTETQMADTMQFTHSQQKLHSLFNELDLDLNNRDYSDTENSDKFLTLNVSNEIWAQKDFYFLESFLDTLMINYGVGVRSVDYIKDSNQACQDINDWVAEQTEDKIKDLVTPSDITPLTRLVLTNTIFFKASWLIPFDPDKTYDGTFYLNDGSTAAVPMMIPDYGIGENSVQYPAVKGSDYTAIELPYFGEDFSMLIIMPDSGMFNSFEQNMDNTKINEIIDSLEGRNVTLRLPKFESTLKLGLNETLKEMGMPDAFDSGLADFSGMNGDTNLYIGKVIHQAAITLDEAGTEASAATAVIAALDSVPTDIMDITINRPFIYLIRDNQTGTTLFMGRMMDPTAG